MTDRQWWVGVLKKSTANFIVFEAFLEEGKKLGHWTKDAIQKKH